MLSRAFRSRFLELHVGDLPDNELEFILQQRCALAPSYSKKLVSVMRDLYRTRQVSAAAVAAVTCVFNKWLPSITHTHTSKSAQLCKLRCLESTTFDAAVWHGQEGFAVAQSCLWKLLLPSMSAKML